MPYKMGFSFKHLMYFILADSVCILLEINFQAFMLFEFISYFLIGII
jgi:hypothetical protein